MRGFGAARNGACTSRNKSAASSRRLMAAPILAAFRQVAHLSRRACGRLLLPSSLLLRFLLGPRRFFHQQMPHFFRHNHLQLAKRA